MKIPPQNCDGIFYAERPFASFYPFTAPAMTPRMMYFWQAR